MKTDELVGVSKKLRSDPYASFVGAQLTRIEKGYAEAELMVADYMLNFNKVAHGGATFSLADVAFAAACNSFNQTAVALFFHIVYRKPVKVGTKLVAEAIEESAGRKTALYRVTVRTSERRVVALCEGLAYKLDSKLAEEDGPEAI